MILRLDFESRSQVPLGGKESVGAWNYANDASTEILMLAHKLDGEEVQLWQPRFGPMPEHLRRALLDPNQKLSAFNSAFERYLLKYKLGIDTAITRWEDPQVGARYLSMPGSLDEVSDILGLPLSMAKDKRGAALIDLFCEQHKAKKKRGEPEVWYWNDWNSHPAEWEEFCEYCKQDIVAEEEVSRRMHILGALPLPPFERRLWEFDQKVNDRGMPVDRDFVEKAYRLAVRAKKEALDAQNAITGLENANSPTQLLPWAKDRGYPFETLRKETVDSVLKDPDITLAPECRQVLTARREASSTSYQKLSAIMRQLSPDNRLRGQFIFMGSARCGRWAGNSVQLHNLARPSPEFENLDNVREARQLIYAEDYEGIKVRFKSVLLTVKNCIRTVFVAETA